MAYEKLNLQDGQVLDAAALAHMEDGIADVLPQNPGAYQYPATDGDGNMVWADRLAYVEEHVNQELFSNNDMVWESYEWYYVSTLSGLGLDSFVIGETYVVQLDGEFYNVQPQKQDEDMIMLGNVGFMDGEQGVPFCIAVNSYDNVIAIASAENYKKVRVFAGNVVYHKIQNEYLEHNQVIAVANTANYNWRIFDTTKGVSEQEMFEAVEKGSDAVVYAIFANNRIAYRLVGPVTLDGQNGFMFAGIGFDTNVDTPTDPFVPFIAFALLGYDADTQSYKFASYMTHFELSNNS